MDKYVLALLNLAVCMPILIVCICRLRVMEIGTTMRRTQWEYALLFMATLASALSPLVNQWPGSVDIGFAAAVFYGLWASRHSWTRDKKDCPPPSTDRGELA